MKTSWITPLGAWFQNGGVRFRLWAPEAERVELLLGSRRRLLLERESAGTWTVHVPGCRAGTRYRYRIDGRGPFPDPASRFQPQGVHGPSEVVNPRSFNWTDAHWQGIPYQDLVFYELHVGTFTPEGTFEALRAQLPYLKDLGINALELMPLGDFPGARNWGYDGVCPFAPARCHGQPAELKRLICSAHECGLAVFLDVVYNHLGPDGNYTGVYSPHYLSKTHRTPWGDALNFDGPLAQRVREFFIENALYWIHEYRCDGLRLDATHAIHDDSPEHFLAELSRRVRASVPEGRHVHLIAEDHRNLAHMVEPPDRGGWGLDGIWADDFHHEMRRHLAGDCEGYYRDYTGTTEDLATTINRGWFFTGQHSLHLNEPRGSDPSGLSPRAFVVCLQNHDQIGNRAFGERLHQQIEPASFRAASALLLCSPATPLLFMGQEWASSAPFRFFTDHTPELGRLVTAGRRREFQHFSAFADPRTRETIPDPQALETFDVCRLDWTEREREPYRGTWHLYQALLKLRREEPALQNATLGSFQAYAVGDSSLVLQRRATDGPDLLLVCQLRGSGVLRAERLPAGWSEIVLSTEESRFCAEPRPPSVGPGGMEFQRPGAVLLRS